MLKFCVCAFESHACVRILACHQQLIQHCHAAPEREIDVDMLETIRNSQIALWQGSLSHKVFRCFAEHGKSSHLMAIASVEVQPDELLLIDFD